MLSLDAGNCGDCNDPANNALCCALESANTCDPESARLLPDKPSNRKLLFVLVFITRYMCEEYILRKNQNNQKFFLIY